MPNFSWKCTKCKHKFDKIQKLKDKNPKCPKCDSDEVERDYNYKGKSPSVKFTGGGYYDSK